jgi:hypothetical protein
MYLGDQLDSTQTANNLVDDVIVRVASADFAQSHDENILGLRRV